MIVSCFIYRANIDCVFVWSLPHYRLPPAFNQCGLYYAYNDIVCLSEVKKTPS